MDPDLLESLMEGYRQKQLLKLFCRDLFERNFSDQNQEATSSNPSEPLDLTRVVTSPQKGKLEGITESHLWAPLRKAWMEESSGRSSIVIPEERPDADLGKTTSSDEQGKLEGITESHLWAPLRKAWMEETSGRASIVIPEERPDADLGKTTSSDEQVVLASKKAKLDVSDSENPACTSSVAIDLAIENHPLREENSELDIGTSAYFGPKTSPNFLIPSPSSAAADVIDNTHSLEQGNFNNTDCHTSAINESNQQNESEILDLASNPFTVRHSFLKASYSETSGDPETTIAKEDYLTILKDNVPFNNGEWVPVIPEPEDEIYWWSFPWRFKFNDSDQWRQNSGHPRAIWKLVAGKTTTHLPEHCLYLMTPPLFYCCMRHPRRVPQTITFAPKYQDVLEYFTERMLGINDFIPVQQRPLLNSLFDLCGYKRSLEIFDRDGLVPDQFPI